MCGRYSLTTTIDRLLPHLRGPLPDGLLEHYAPRLQVRPSEPVLLQRQEHGRLAVGLALWGLVPEWSKDPLARGRPIKAALPRAWHLCWPNPWTCTLPCRWPC